MMRRLLQWLFIACALAACGSARAITCTQSPTSVNVSYLNRTTPVVQGTFSIACTRVGGEPTNSVSYDVSANNGANPNNQGDNRANLGNATVTYDLYTDSGCATLWNTTNKIAGSLSWNGNSSGTKTNQHSFWMCVPRQSVGGQSGTYADTVTMTLAVAGSPTTTAPVNVEIYAPAVCTINTQPGLILLNYVGLGAEVSNFTTMVVTCTTGMPFTVAPNVPEGVLVNLRYLLSMNKNASTGTGTAETFTITATIPAGQSGTCTVGPCSASQTHTIVISY